MKPTMNNVYRQSQSQCWVIQWKDPKGNKKAKSFSDKKLGGRVKALEQAEATLKKIQYELIKGSYIDPQRNKISLEDFKEDFGIVSLKQKQSTKNLREDIWTNYIAPYDIASKPIGVIRGNDIAQHIKSLRKPNGDSYSHSTIVKVVEVFRVLFDKALDEDYITGKNPATSRSVLDWVPKQEKPKHIYLTLFEVNAIYNEIKKTHPEYAVAIPLLAMTGLRSGEFRALTYDDIDFNKGTISVNKSISDNNDMKISEPKTDSSVREIQIDNITLKRLREHKDKYKREECNFLFPNRDCNNAIMGRNFKNRILKPAIKELDMDNDINLHTFRHTSVYLAFLSGADIYSISKRLGHKDIGLTSNTYSDLFKEIDTKLVEGLEKLQQEVI